LSRDVEGVKKREGRKKMKRLITAMGFLIVLFICTTIGAPIALSETLIFANLFPMSGGAAAWGIAADRGVRMAVDDINNRGGLKVGSVTYKIEVVTMDHRYVPGEALGAAKKVVREGIKFTFGLGGGVTPALQPVLEENKVIYIFAGGGGVEFTNAKCPYTFRSIPSSDMIYNVFLPRFVKMWGPIKAGYVYNNDENGRSDLRTVRKVVREQNLPIEEVTEFVERDAIDFSPIVTRLMAKGTNLILNELTPGQSATFFKQTWEFGYKGHKGIIRASFDVGSLLKGAGKEALEGLITDHVNWPPGQSPTAMFEEFRQKYLSIYKEDAPANALERYASVQFLAAALEKAGTLDTERVAKVMYDLEAETIFGPTFMVGKTLGYGIKTQMSYPIPVCEMRDGKFKVIDVLRYKE
jgi:branched-chain amino acid transport system substrate-binding protein